MTLADAAAGTMLVGLVLYALTGGADFGGGVWDLLASGPRKAAQRRLVEHAIAPVWEANHVWLIFVVVVLFSAFPSAYAAITVALHVPLVLLLVGIVLRGAAFVFRQYGEYAPGSSGERRWARVFQLASLLVPLALGDVVGAITDGSLRLAPDGRPLAGWFAPWLGPLPLATGLFALALFAFLAAVYLTVEASDAATSAAGHEAPIGDERRALADDFRRRALVTGVLVALTALVAGVTVALHSPTGRAPGPFAEGLLRAPWTWPLQLATGASAIGALVALYRRRFRLARAAAIAQVTLILLGWALAQRPLLVAPDLRIDETAAPARVLALTLGAVAVGALVLVPSLYAMLRVFKRAPSLGRTGGAGNRAGAGSVEGNG